MSAAISIGVHQIGSGRPSWVIAEVGVNHNGDLGLAHELIDAAVGTGADAVKFQAFTPELLAAEDAPQAEYQRLRAGAASQREMLAGLALDESGFRDLKEHAERSGITFLASVFDETAVDLLDRLQVLAIKIPSGELTNHRLLARVAQSGVPILMSTGMATMEEVDAAVTQLGSAREKLALLHCVSSYPADPHDCNLRVMDVMRRRYELPVGWSDHTDGVAVSIAAVALGANVIEKHLTLSRDLPGPDHRASLEPTEMRAMVDGIRAAEAALGEPIKQPSAAERAIADVARKSLHWSRALKPGETVDAADLIPLRPGTAIAPSRLAELVGHRARVATVPGAIASFDDIER